MKEAIGADHFTRVLVLETAVSRRETRCCLWNLHFRDQVGVTERIAEAVYIDIQEAGNRK